MALPLLSSLLASDALWNPTSIQDLHREYGNIFRHGNRNAASHLWSTYLFDRTTSMSAATMEMMFSGFCAVSGSPTRPSDYTRYRLTLPLVSGGVASGYMYYCCWPCVCDTQDFIRIDTRNVTLAGGEVRQYHWAVVGNPCDDPSALHRPFVQPFHGRGETTLAREAAEVRCDAEGRLIGATLSDHGYPIIAMFFDADVYADADAGVRADGSHTAPPTSSAAIAWATQATPQPGRQSTSPSGVHFQDEYEFGPMCADRAANGYNSGMGEIFRKVASISPVQLKRAEPPALPALPGTPPPPAANASDAAPELASFEVSAHAAAVSSTADTPDA